MPKSSIRNSFLVAATFAALLLPATPAAAAPDVVTVGSGSAAPSATIDIPVSIRDTSGSPLGLDQPAGSRIQSYSIKVDYAPASAIQSITFTRGGITTSLTPTFESMPSGPGTVSLLDTFQESTNLIPFTLDGALPGNQVGVLHVTVAPSAVPGTTVTLTLDPLLTQLTDQAGSGATKETVANGNLVLVNGLLTVASLTGNVPTLSTWALLLLAVSLAAVALRMRF
jgi:hypothetical protein